MLTACGIIGNGIKLQIYIDIRYNAKKYRAGSNNLYLGI